MSRLTRPLPTIRWSAPTVVSLVAGLIGALLVGLGPASAQTLPSGLTSASLGTVTADQVGEIATRKEIITARDGVKLDGTVIGPKQGNWPLIVVPGTFAPDQVEMEFMATQLAPRGYIIVTYAERGFGKSEGKIDCGGPDDVNDVSDALTWALANTNAIPEQVGVAGSSYGAGFVPIVLAKDKRFKAAASISGWADMWRSLYPNQTGSFTMNLALYALSLRNKPSPAMKDFFTKAINNKFDATSREFARQRSGATYLDVLNERKVPLYMSTTMNEMAWPIDQNIDFYNAYAGPKHLDLLPGDHSTAETGQGMNTLPATWATAFEWFDHYLADRSDNVTSLPPVRVVTRSPKGPTMDSTDKWTNWPWEAVQSTAVRATERRYLATNRNWWGGGLILNTTLDSKPGTATKSLRDGHNTLVNNGIPMYQGIFETVTGVPSTVALALVDQTVTGVWTGPKQSQDLNMQGATKVHLDATPSAAKGSAFAYLIDQAPDGQAYLIGQKPYSWSGATPGQPMSIDFEVPFQAFKVPAGHRVVVAVSTDDANYSGNTPTLSTLKIGPGSYVDLPLK